MTRRVVIVQRRLTHYRVPFFNALRAELARRGLDLVLLVGQGTREEVAKNDAGSLPWAHGVPTYYAARGKLCWQNLKPYLHDADLVIVTQENKLLHNFPLLLSSRRRYSLAFWGHGANLQSNRPHGLKERLKRWTSRKVDWWFAYTDASRGLIAATGFPPERISTVNNAVDTLELAAHIQSITPAETAALRESLGFGPGPVGAFVGSLYADKRLDFLFGAAQAIRAVIPDFQLLILGDGPERQKVRDWCESHPWSRWMGAKRGREKVEYLKLSEIMLNPGAIGLGLLDSFVMELPVVVTEGGNHGPEIAYLENGTNGVKTANNLHAYRDACVSLLQNPNELNRLRAGCEHSGRLYTLENMVERFANGICTCLASPPLRLSRL